MTDLQAQAVVTEGATLDSADRVAELTGADRRWVLAYAMLFMLVTSIPYLLAYAAQGSDWRFTGFVFGVEDGNSYIAKMARGTAGAWLFRTPYTIEPQTGVLAFLPYTLLGKLAAPPGTHEQLVALFHIFRFVAGVLSILAVYEFLAFYIPERKLRRLGVLLASLGGGLGWLAVLAGRGDLYGSMPLDFYSPETFGFLSLFGLPHLSLARAGFFFCLVIILRTARDEHRSLVRNALLAGVWWLVVGLAQPLTAVLIALVLGLGLALPLVASFLPGAKTTGEMRRAWRRGFWAALIAGLIPGPFILYNFWRFSFDPFLSAWTSQNLILSPHPVHYLLAYGLILPFALVGLKSLFGLRAYFAWLPVSWALAIPLLVYLPYNLQRRLAEGGWVALVCLGLAGAYASKAWRRALWLVSPAFLLSSLVLFFGALGASLSPGLPLFRPQAEVAAFEYLAENAAPDEVVLSAFEAGNALPAWAPLRVPIGHGPESVHLEAYQRDVASIYSQDTSTTERKDLLDALGIDYVFWGPEERILGAWNPSDSVLVSPWYSAQGYSIYMVRR